MTAKRDTGPLRQIKNSRKVRFDKTSTQHDAVSKIFKEINPPYNLRQRRSR